MAGIKEGVVTCSICGERVSRICCAYYLDVDTGEVWHLDCDDFDGGLFGDDGMPLTKTVGVRMIEEREVTSL